MALLEAAMRARDGQLAAAQAELQAMQVEAVAFDVYIDYFFLGEGTF